MPNTMQNMTLEKIALACEGKLCQASKPTREITCAHLDSRKINEGGLFFATIGEKVDGHSFIGQVFEKGALCVVTQKTPAKVEQEHGVPADCWGAYILVEDTFAALKKIAAYYRQQLSIPVIGITGSVGKTSTKEFIAGVLAQKYNVLKTEGNFNNEIGLPLTLLSIRREHEAAVVEMGISDFGEMSRLGAMARPDICVITNIGQCHLENLHDRAGILKAKTEIFDYLQPDGEVCLNGEDDLLYAIKNVNGKPVHHFGLTAHQGLDVYATDIENLGLLGSRAKLHMDNKEIPIEVPLPGQHMVINATAAALVGELLGLSAKELQKGISQVASVAGRSNLIRHGEQIIIDDCYNANPVSMKAAIDLLTTALGRKVAVLGDMFELGDNSDALHAEVGAYAVEQGVDALYCAGENARFIYEAALEKQKPTQEIYYFKDREALCVSLPGLLKDKDTILVKASHGMGFNRIVDLLKEI